MISGIAFCPSPPALVPEVAGSAGPELTELRAETRHAVERVADLNAPLVVLGPGPTSQAHSPLCRGSLAGFGVPLELHLGSPGCGGAVDLPLSLTVGAWLLASAIGPRSGARGFSVGRDFAASAAAVELLAVAQTEEVALLVMGDGSARTGTKAPGYFDDRSAGFDAQVAHALGSGDVDALAAIDPQLGAELLACGVGAWRAAANVLDRQTYQGELRYSAAPFGVAYVVATWLAGV